MSSRINGNGSNPTDEIGADELTQSELTRPSPDAILADEADPDTLLGIESDSEAGGSRPVSMLINSAGGKRTSKRISKQLQEISLDPFSSATQKDGDEETPRKTNFIKSAGNTGTANHISPALDEAGLKDQVTELTTQVTGLNNKLVNSFVRIGDLEDDLSEMQESIANYRKQIDGLQKEREEHLAALNTGLLVEKEHVSNEMQKMMERLVQETAEKGKAVDERQKIESELDELSSSLFSEANKMVAVERLARARAEEKSKSMEERLKDTEEIVGAQQRRLVELQAVVEKSEKKISTTSSQSQDETDDIQDASFHSTGLLSKPTANQTVSHPLHSRNTMLRLDIVPYVELRAFLNHLRRLRLQLSPFYNYPIHDHSLMSDDISQGTPIASRTGSPAPNQHGTPSSTSGNVNLQSSPFLAAGVTRHRDFPTLPANVEQLIHLPNQVSSLTFLKRLNDEDCEPCLGLDNAPGLNWLSKRQMRTAILDGSFMIEPIFGGGIYDEESVRSKAVGAPPAACALCGKAVVNVPLPGGGSVSDASTWMSTASSIQASVNAMANSLPVREMTGSPPPVLHGNSTGLTTPKEMTRSKSSIFSTLRNISGGRSNASSSEKSSIQSVATDANSSTPSQPIGVVEDLFAVRPPAIPTHIFRISESSTARYLICPDFCLGRVRATCDFWGYVRNLERAVVLEGKFAWDDEATIEEESAPRLPTKDANMNKGGLSESEKEDVQKQDSEEVESKIEVSESNDDPENKEGGDKKEEEEKEEEENDVTDSPQSNTKASAPHSASHAASDAEDDHDFADAKSQNSDDDEDEAEKEEGEAEKALQPPIEIEEKAEKDARTDQDEPSTKNEEEEPNSTPVPSPLPKSADLTKADQPPPLPQTARPVPKLPNANAPALPPRRVRTPANVASASIPGSPRVIDLGPEPRRLLPTKNVEKPVWEEKVWIEVNRLRADMWSARVGIKSDDE